MRKDFWLDLFYVLFNFFLFSMLGWYAGTEVIKHGLQHLFEAVGYGNQVALEVASWPAWAYYLLLFMVGDFISWGVHRLLHAVPWLWEFHKVHHSVEEMGFAAHVRYHWMENVIYWSFRVVPLTFLGFDLVDLFALHVLNVAWGHFNHVNMTVSPRVTGTIFGSLLGAGLAASFGWDAWQIWAMAAAGSAVGATLLGPSMRYLFNSPEMHIWHHAYDLPGDKPRGINFGITLAIWDYLFKTAHVPSDGRDIRLGFPGIESFPKGFFGQLVHGFFRSRN